MHYVIQDENDMFWSNDYGWVNGLEEAEVFCEHERDTADLPMCDTSADFYPLIDLQEYQFLQIISAMAEQYGSELFEVVAAQVATLTKESVADAVLNASNRLCKVTEKVIRADSRQQELQEDHS